MLATRPDVCYLVDTMKPQIEAVIAEARRLEALAMSVYLRLARALQDKPELYGFWMSMARHEAGHVGALELLRVMLDEAKTQGLCVPHAGQNTAGAAAVMERLHREAAGPVSVARAFAMAVELESVELEDLVLDLIDSLSDEPQWRQTEQMLLHDLSDLSLMIEKYTHDDVLLARADALVERHVGRREKRYPRATEK